MRGLVAGAVRVFRGFFRGEIERRERWRVRRFAGGGQDCAVGGGCRDCVRWMGREAFTGGGGQRSDWFGQECLIWIQGDGGEEREGEGISGVNTSSSEDADGCKVQTRRRGGSGRQPVPTSKREGAGLSNEKRITLADRGRWSMFARSVCSGRAGVISEGGVVGVWFGGGFWTGDEVVKSTAGCRGPSTEQAWEEVRAPVRCVWSSVDSVQCPSCPVSSLWSVHCVQPVQVPRPGPHAVFQHLKVGSTSNRTPSGYGRPAKEP